MIEAIKRFFSAVLAFFAGRHAARQERRLADAEAVAADLRRQGMIEGNVREIPDAELMQSYADLYGSVGLPKAGREGLLPAGKAPPPAD